MIDFTYSAEEKGKGNPVLFLHGYLSNKESFYFQMECLSELFKTVAVDLPGFGKTPEPPFAFSLDDYVNFTADIINKHCSGKADIVAHSFGGRIALKLAATRPETVGKLLLTGCAGMKPKRKPAYYLKIGVYKTLKKLSPKLSAKWKNRYSSPDYIAVSEEMRKSFVMIVNEHLEKYLPEISAPTLLVFGDKDNQTPLYMAHRLNRGIKGSGLVVMKGCSHFCFSENPVFFNTVAKEFLSN